MPSLERPEEPLRPSELLREEELLLALRLEVLEPDDALRPRSLELDELDDEPCFEALRPSLDDSRSSLRVDESDDPDEPVEADWLRSLWLF